MMKALSAVPSCERAGYRRQRMHVVPGSTPWPAPRLGLHSPAALPRPTGGGAAAEPARPGAWTYPPGDPRHHRQGVTVKRGKSLLTKGLRLVLLLDLCKLFSCAATLDVIMVFFVCFFVGMSDPVHIRTHKSTNKLTNQTKLKSL